VHAGLCEALGHLTELADELGVHVAVEITRAGSVGSAESYLRLRDVVQSNSLGVCMDPANFTPDRTPLERAVRILAPDIVIAHAKDVAFDERGEVAEYGPTGSGTLDTPRYLSYLRQWAPAPYLVLEYYQSREDLLRARDIVAPHL
jgi:sugar phosphate isomerase/epimerase